MINDDKVIAEKKLATKNIILVVVLGLVAVVFYAGIILVYT